MLTKLKIFGMLCVTLVMLSIPSHADKGMDYWLNRLDESLDHRAEYEQMHLDRIERLKTELKQAREDDKFEICYSLYDAYKVYCYDSARTYAYDCLQRAQAQHDDARIVRSKHAVAFCLISAGILSEARDVLGSIDRSKLSGDALIEYYDHYSHLWRSMADYVNEEPFYTQYITKSKLYMDSLLTVLPEGSLRWWACKSTHLMRDQSYEAALKSIEKTLALSENDGHMHAMAAAEMAWAYIWLGDEDKAIEYFAQSAISDNETATREITALYHLARFIYKKGDYDRASRYVHQALEDVNFYNTRLRKVEINDILPIIEQDRYDAVRSQRNWLFATTGLVVALLLGILWSYWFIRRKNHKLTEARETIAGQLEQLREANTQLQQMNSQLQQVNTQVQQANRQLQEADKIKTAYIGRSFYSNAEFIEKLEKVYMAIDRKITTRQYDDLRYTLKQSTLNAERENMYQAFDQTFIKLFPHFVERYNELFDDKDRKLPPDEHSLTSEMRIFALIRLGITDSERIAKFLDYSVHTVNTYKTRIKNRSTVDNDQFETLIMEI